MAAPRKNHAKKKTRKKIHVDVELKVLIEAGYRCAVPTCRNILAIDLHHMVEVSEGGGDEPGNLLALCPTCHALYHRGVISKDAIFAWKVMLVSLCAAFDLDTIDLLVFMTKPGVDALRIDGGGVLRFARLIAADLVLFKWVHDGYNRPPSQYTLELTTKGRHLINAWCSGDRAAMDRALSGHLSGS